MAGALLRVKQPNSQDVVVVLKVVLRTPYLSGSEATLSILALANQSAASLGAQSLLPCCAPQWPSHPHHTNVWEIWCRREYQCLWMVPWHT